VCDHNLAYPVQFTSLETGEPLTLPFGDIIGAQRMEKGTMVFVQNEGAPPTDVGNPACSLPAFRAVMVSEDFDRVADLIELKPCRHCGSRECDGKCLAACAAKFNNVHWDSEPGEPLRYPPPPKE
jgi:hypothetical protein